MNYDDSSLIRDCSGFGVCGGESVGSAIIVTVKISVDEIV
jgi:hypothetical protein